MNDLELARFLETSPLAWWEWQVTADVVRCNDLKAAWLGYDPLDYQGKGYRAFTDLLNPEDLPIAMDSMQGLLDGRSPLYQVDYRIRAKDGSWRWYLDRGLVFTRLNGRPERIRGIVVDLGKEGRESGTSAEVIELLLAFSGETWSDESQSVAVLCSCCQKVKWGPDSWIPLSPGVRALAGRLQSHGLCPDCLVSLYPDYAAKILAKQRSN